MVVAADGAHRPAVLWYAGQEWLSCLTVPRMHVDDPRLPQRLRDELPVVIQGTGFADVARAKWTLDYLAANCGDGSRFTVYSAPTPHFRFSDSKHNSGGCALHSPVPFTCVCRGCDDPATGSPCRTPV